MIEEPPDPPPANKMGDVRGPGVQAEHIGTINFNVPEIKLPHELPPVAHRQMFNTIPPRAGCFQQRVTARHLASVIDDGGTAVLTGTHVLSGLGGVGKTQLAADYAHTLWDAGELDLMVWIAAGSREAIVSDYTRLAIEVVGADTEQGVRQLLQWLATTTKRWLVVLDDLASPGDMQGLWPPHSPTGRVVVTTRRRDHALTGDRRRVIEVDLFTPDESVAYLNEKLPGRADGADGLAADLGHLPLALAQAAAYIADRKLTCASFRKRLADHRRTLPKLLPDDALSDGYQVSVAATWSLSIELADKLTSVGWARSVLELASLLDPVGIPRELFNTKAVMFHLEMPDEDDVEDVLSCLHRLNLITLDPDSAHRDVRVHPLVQRATRERIDAEGLTATAIAAAEGLVELWPDIEGDEGLATCLRSNTMALHAAAAPCLWTPRAHPVLHRAAHSLTVAGLTTAAAEYRRQLHSAAIEHLGADHARTLIIRNNNAVGRGNADDAAGAVVELEALVTDALLVLGPEHPVTLRIRSNLAVWRGEADHPARAVADLEDVLADRVRVLEPYHPDTLRTRGNLAVWRFKAGDLEQAITDLERLAVDQQRVPPHARPSRTLENLAYFRSIADKKDD